MPSDSIDDVRPVGREPEAPVWLREVRSQVESLRFGQVQIVVHDGRVVQIEKVEKIRFESKAKP